MKKVSPEISREKWPVENFSDFSRQIPQRFEIKIWCAVKNAWDGVISALEYYSKR